MRLPENSEKLTALERVLAARYTTYNARGRRRLLLNTCGTRLDSQDTTRNMRWINFGTQASNMVTYSGMDSMGAEADKAGCSRDELAAAGKKITELFEDHGAHNNICYQKKKELGTCTRIEIKGTCGTTEVITASMAC